MKDRWLKLAKRVVAPLALIGAMAAFSPVSALAAEHGGGRGGFAGHGGGHSFSGRTFSAPARGFSAPAHGFSGGRGYYGGNVRHYVGPRYYGGGYGFGLGVGVYPYGYGYAAPVCNPPGFYDQNGVWETYPGCAVPYGY